MGTLHREREEDNPFPFCLQPTILIIKWICGITLTPYDFQPTPVLSSRKMSVLLHANPGLMQHFYLGRHGINYILYILIIFFVAILVHILPAWGNSGSEAIRVKSFASHPFIIRPTILYTIVKMFQTHIYIVMKSTEKNKVGILAVKSNYLSD